MTSALRTTQEYRLVPLEVQALRELNEIRDMISLKLRQKKMVGITMKEMAQKAKVATSTISRFVYGETKSPRSDTLFKLALYVDLKIIAIARQENI